MRSECAFFFELLFLLCVGLVVATCVSVWCEEERCEQKKEIDLQLSGDSDQCRQPYRTLSCTFRKKSRMAAGS